VGDMVSTIRLRVNRLPATRGSESYWCHLFYSEDPDDPDDPEEPEGSVEPEGVSGISSAVSTLALRFVTGAGRVGAGE
jgi:hypothetical protein